MHATIAGFGLDRPLANQLDDKVSKVEGELAKGKDGCPKLDDLLHATINNAGNKGLSFAEAVRLLDAGERRSAALSCASAVPPKPAAVDDLVELLARSTGWA